MALPVVKDSKLWLALLHELIEAGGAAGPQDIYPKMRKYFPSITDEDVQQTNNSGNNIWTNRIQWARQELVLRGCVARGPRGAWPVTDGGRRWHDNEWQGPDADYSAVYKPDPLDSAGEKSDKKRPSATPKPDKPRLRSAEEAPSETTDHGESFLSNGETGPLRQPNYTIQDFVEETGFKAEEIKNWLARLTRKRQVILQGPPGTGKTFVAERLAKLMVSGTAGFWQLVQFHPDYAYEDFIQGLRPMPVDGHVMFQLERGRFVSFCNQARERPAENPCVLIIDEINRANLPRVFGELMYLLEYRDKEIPLAAGGPPFGIPSNVYVLATMNTADRSIALVDYAFRRRFSFIRLSPNFDILEQHLRAQNLPAASLLSVLREVNAEIGDPNYELGISFFLRADDQLRTFLPDIWQGEIEPYLEEYFYDQQGKVAAFRWAELKRGKLADWAIEPPPEG